MKHGIIFPLAIVLGTATQVQSLDLQSVLATVGAGGEGGLISSVDGIELDGLALARLGGSTIIASPTTTPLVAARVLEPPTEDGQIIARVTIGEGLAGDGLQLGNLLGSLSTGGDDDGNGDLIGGVLDTVGDLAGINSGDGGVLGGLVGGTGGNGGLVGGLTDTLGNLTGGVLD